jgi:DNA polymerase III subunit epsilon
MRDRDLAIVDVETTGGSAESHRIIEIAVLRVTDGELRESYSTLVNPEQPIGPFIEHLTGIRNRELAKAPTFDEVSGEVLGRLDGATFVAHNAHFDYGFVQKEFERQSVRYEAPCLCTMRLSKLLFPEHRHHGLDSIIERFNITCIDRHRAMGDARVLWDFLRILERTYGADHLGDVLGRAVSTPSQPPLISEDTIRSLPSSAGVYVFYDDEGHPLYVGKSINVRHRVLSHFSGAADTANARTLFRTVAGVEVIPTASELGALFIESHMIRKLHPTLNRRLKNRRNVVVAKRTTTEKGYRTMKLGTLEKFSLREIPAIGGVFKAYRHGKTFLWDLAERYGLCPKMLGLEKGGGSCSWTRLNRCNGACAGKEPPESYNLRFDQAFLERKVRTWPFKGPILLREQDRSPGEGEAFVIDNWCLVAAFRYNEFGKRNLVEENLLFDYDVYKIIEEYLLRSKRRFALKELAAEEVEEILSA